MEVAWITAGTRVGRAITSGVPPLFAAYATIVLPDPEDGLDPPEKETEWMQYLVDSGRTARARHGSFCRVPVDVSGRSLVAALDALGR